MSKYLPWVFLLCVAGFFIGKYLYMQPKYITGEKAPNFTATTLSGKSFELSNLEGKYVLLDFWGSWCGPCLQELPDLKALQSKYQEKNLVIVNVAVEQNEARWQKAVERLGMNWEHQVLDLATSLRFFDSKIAELYGVKQVPSKFLINPNGEIIGSNISFEAMDKLLETRLK